MFTCVICFQKKKKKKKNIYDIKFMKFDLLMLSLSKKKNTCFTNVLFLPVCTHWAKIIILCIKGQGPKVMYG